MRPDPANAPVLDTADATRLVRQHVNPALTVAAVRLLAGGSVYHVYEFIVADPAHSVVAKMSPHIGHAPLRQEFASLRWYAEQTRLPVPCTFACVDVNDAAYSGTWLFMSRAPGRNLEEAKLTPAGRRFLMTQLARHLVNLHGITRKTYGGVAPGSGRGSERWLDVFEPDLRREYAAVRDQLSSHARSVIDDLLPALGAWLPEAGVPAAIHGDLWATNIIVDDARAERPIITAFIDAGARFADPEFELAYLRVFRTVDRTFFDEYTRHRPLRRGFSRRCRVYWLYFMLTHVNHFGPTYLRQCESLARQIEQMGKRKP